ALSAKVPYEVVAGSTVRCCAARGPLARRRGCVKSTVIEHDVQVALAGNVDPREPLIVSKILRGRWAHAAEDSAAVTRYLRDTRLLRGIVVHPCRTDPRRAAVLR